MRKIALILLAVLLVPGWCFAEGTARVYSDTTDPVTKIRTIMWNCTSSATAAPGEIVNDSKGVVAGVTGWIIGWWVYPDDTGDIIFAGNAQPTNAFNAELRCSHPLSNNAQAFTLTWDIAYDLTASCSNTAPTGGTPVDSVNGSWLWIGNASLNVYGSAVGSTKSFIAVATIDTKKKECDD